MNASLLCPYPACGQTLESATNTRTCSCAYRQAVAACSYCGILNRAGARICRACRFELAGHAAAANPAASSAAKADFLAFEGRFRRPPVVAGSFLYALSIDGALSQLSPRTGAQAREIARLQWPAAGFNRGAAVHISPGNNGAAAGTGPRGWTFLAVSPSAVEAVSLVTSEVRTLYQPPAGQQIAANTLESEAMQFRGLVATSDFCAFAVRTGPAQATLTIRYFAEDRAIAQPLQVHGSSILGPAFHDGCVVLCTESEAGLYDTRSETTKLVPLPRSFRPLTSRSRFDLQGPGSLPPTSRSSFDLKVPAGHLPLTYASVAGGPPEAWIAGHGLDDRPGFLRVDFKAGHSRFEPLPGITSIATNSDGSLSVSSSEAGLQGIGHALPSGRPGARQAAMPVVYEAPYFVYFAEQSIDGRHRLQVSSPARSFQAEFEDRDCDPESCCEVFVVGDDLLVAYLDIDAGPQGKGLKLAHRSLAE